MTVAVALGRAVAFLWLCAAAAPALAKTPLETCYEKAGDKGRTAVGPCLDAMLKDASAEMAAALAARRKDAQQLVKATGRKKSVKSLDTTQKQFVAYRRAQCRYVADAMDAGTGAGDAQRDCMVRLTRQRTEELRGYP